MSGEADEVLRELMDWCRWGEQRFAAALAAETATAGTPETRRRGTPIVPRLWAWEMHWHTDIPVSQLHAAFRSDSWGVDLAVVPDWRTSSNAERLRCIATLILMTAQLVTVRDSRPAGVPLAELEERCRAFESVTAASGDLKHALEREHVRAAYRIYGAASTVSFTWDTRRPKILTTPARDACARSVTAVLPVKRV